MNKLFKVVQRIILTLLIFLKAIKICNSFIVVNRNEILLQSDASVSSFLSPSTKNNKNKNYNKRNIVLNLVKQEEEQQVRIKESSNTKFQSKSKKKKMRYNNYDDKRIIEKQKKICMEISKEGRRGNFVIALKLYNNSIKDKLCNTRILNSIIDACARTRPAQYTIAMTLFANRPSYIKPNVFTFGSLISVCSRSCNSEKAIELLRTMKDVYHIEPNDVVYSTVIASCSRAQPKPDAEQALLLLDEVVANKKISMNVVGYNAVLSTLAKVGDAEKAIDILNKMEEGYYNNIMPDYVSYCTVMAACERAQRWEDILYYANIMKNNKCLTLDGIAITNILHACQALGYADLALEYLQLMKENSKNNDNMNNNNKYKYNRRTNGRLRQGVKAPLLHPDHVAYCLTISACSKAGRIKDSIKLFQELNVLNKTSVKAYTAVIDGCSTIGNYQLALKLLNNMYSKFKLEPTVVTYSSVISACASAIAKLDKANHHNHNIDHHHQHNNNDIDVIERENIIDKAYSLFHNISTSNDTSIHPNIITYNAMLQVYAEGYKLQKCFQLFQQLVQDKKQRNIKPTIVTFGTLMSACERVGNVTAINDVFHYMDLYDIQPNEIVYGAAISCYRKAKQPEKALQLLYTMISSNLKPNIVTFNTVIYSLIESNSNINKYHYYQTQKNQPKGFYLNKALELYQTYLIQNDNSYNDEEQQHNNNNKLQLQPNMQTYQILIRALSNAQRPKEAEIILRHMIASSSSSFTASYNNNNIIQQQQNNNKNPDVHLYTGIVTAYERINQPKNSLRLLEEMREIGYDFYDSKLLNELFKRMVKLVHWGTSVVVVSE